MKRTNLTATLLGSAAAGLIALATPALAQSTTYPAGTDCSALENSANRTDCMHQMNESRQNQTPSATEQDSVKGGDQQQGPANGIGNGDATGNAPSSQNPDGNETGTTNPGGLGGTGSGGATQ